MYRDLKWSPSEKKVARKAYDAALESALGQVMAEFKRRTAAAATLSPFFVLPSGLQWR